MNLIEQRETHVCKSFQKDNFIVFYCDDCDFEMIDDLEKNEQVYHNMKADIRHCGFHKGD